MLHNICLRYLVSEIYVTAKWQKYQISIGDPQLRQVFKAATDHVKADGSGLLRCAPQFLQT